MRSKVFLPASLLAVGLLSLPALPANALACSLGSVTATGLGAFTSCIGSFDGNDVGAKGTLETKLSTGVFNGLKEWQFVGKSDERGFNTSQGTSGTWSLNNNNTLTGPFVLSLKTSTSWSAYFFQGMDDLKVSGGSWTTNGVSTNNKGIAQALSHATIYRAVIKTPPPKPRSVPEPGTTAALGLLAVGAIGRLRQKGVG